MKKSNKYLVETIVFISYVLFAMTWVGGTASMNPIMLSMELESLANASLLSGAVTLAKIFGTFIAAWVAMKVGIKYAFFIACLLISTGLLTPLSPNYELLLTSRFLMGLGGALMIVYFNPIVMHWFSSDERPAVNGMNAVSFNVGTAIILWFMIDIDAVTGSWKLSLIAFSVASIILSFLWLLISFGDDEDKLKFPKEIIETPYTYWQGMKDKFNWAYAFTYSGLLSFYICLFTFYPQAEISNSKWVIGFGIIFSKKISLRIPVLR